MTKWMRLATLGVAATLIPAVLSGCSASSCSSSDKNSLSIVGFSVHKTANEPVIAAFQKTPAGKDISFTTSYGASGDQSRAVASGLHADEVHLSVRRASPVSPQGRVHVGQVVLGANGLLSPSVGQPQGADLVTYPVPAAHRVYVRYQISGAVQRAGPDGRALARVTSLDVETGARLHETTDGGQRAGAVAGLLVVGAGSGRRTVRVRRPRQLERAAGSPGRADRVMAQLDLS